MHKIHSEAFESYETSVTQLACCGIQEFANLRRHTANLGTPGAVYKIADMYALMRMNGRFLIFSQVVGQGEYGDLLKAFIETTRLGVVTQSNDRVNPNSSNTLRVFLWEVDRDALKEWYIRLGPSKAAIKMDKERMAVGGKSLGYFHPEDGDEVVVHPSVVGITTHVSSNNAQSINVPSSLGVGVDSSMSFRGDWLYGRPNPFGER